MQHSTQLPHRRKAIIRSLFWKAFTLCVEFALNNNTTVICYSCKSLKLLCLGISPFAFPHGALMMTVLPKAAYFVFWHILGKL